MVNRALGHHKNVAQTRTNRGRQIRVHTPRVDPSATPSCCCGGRPRMLWLGQCYTPTMTLLTSDWSGASSRLGRSARTAVRPDGAVVLPTNARPAAS